MAFKRSKSFSMVFLAMATLLLLLAGDVAHARKVKSGKSRKLTKSSSGAGGGDICRKADNPALCRAVVKGQKSPYAATQATVKQLIAETAAVAKKASAGAAAAAKKKGKSSPAWQAYDVCRENYGDALSSLRASLADMGKRDKGGFNSNLSAALTDYVTCDDTFDEMGVPSPLAKTNARLRNIAGNGLYLATLWH